MRLARVDGQLAAGYMPVFDLFVDCHCLVDWMYFLTLMCLFVNRFHATVCIWKLCIFVKENTNTIREHSTLYCLIPETN